MSSARPRLPHWLRVQFRGGRARGEVRRLLRDLNLNTVCEGANCPNLCECWQRKTATFMLLGDTCTRNCRFCDVGHGEPRSVDVEEPERVALAAERLGLKYVVITSVTRDDLPDGGAEHFAATVRAVRGRLPKAGIEVLPPDFEGRKNDVATVMAAQPSVFNHNLETCARLTPEIRSGADYQRSLRVLSHAAACAAGSRIGIKSGIMVGLGESDEEIREMLGDLRNSGVSIVTIGQYLPPSAAHWPLGRYVTPLEFEQWERTAREEFGFQYVFSGPLVRSSYMAEKAVTDGEL